MTPATEQAVSTLKLFVGGKWIESTATATSELRNPATNALLARVPMGGQADVDRAPQTGT